MYRHYCHPCIGCLLLPMYPVRTVEALEKDRRALGLSPREYIMHLLARRYERVLSHGPAFDTKKSKK